ESMVSRNSYSRPSAAKYPFSSATHSWSLKCGATTNLLMTFSLSVFLANYHLIQNVCRRSFCRSPGLIAGREMISQRVHFEVAPVERSERRAVADRDDRRLRQALGECGVHFRLKLFVERRRRFIQQ